MAQAPVPSPAPPAKRRRRRRSRLPAVLGLALLAAVACGGGYVFRHSEALQKYLPVLWKHGLRQSTPADAFPGKDSVNVLVIGRDAEYDNKDQIIHTRTRSDVLMMARVDFLTHDVSLLSIPRDTLARVEGHGTTKINAAHRFGGPDLTAQTVQQNFGIASDGYADLDFAGFQKAIDEVGGVDLTVDKQMDYDDNWGHLHIHLKPGFQHLNGEQAMGFVRFRHSDSDLLRVRRQQALLAALKAKLRDPRLLTRLPNLLDTLDTHLDSNFTPEQKLVLARFLQATPREHIRMTTLPSLPRGAAVACDWERAAPLLQSEFHATAPAQAAERSTLRHHSRHRAPALREAALP